MRSIKMIVILLCKFSNVQVRDAAESSQPRLDREDSSSELTASRKEGTKGRVSDVRKKTLTLIITFEVFIPFLTHTKKMYLHHPQNILQRFLKKMTL